MDQREKLIKLIKHCTSCEVCRDEDIADHLIANGVVFVDTEKVRGQEVPLITHFMGRPIPELIDIIEAKDKGRLIAVPCNVNESIFVLQRNSVAEKKVERIEINSGGSINFAFDWHGMGYEYQSIKDFGKTVFLTREEAEKALAERRIKEND